MINSRIIEDQLFAFVASNSGLNENQIVWAFEGGTAPEPPYILLSIVSGWRKSGVCDERKNNKHIAVRQITFGIQAIGEDAHDCLANLATELEYTGIPKISVVSVSPIVNLSGFLSDSTKTEKRFSMDFVARVCFTRTEAKKNNVNVDSITTSLD